MAINDASPDKAELSEPTFAPTGDNAPVPPAQVPPESNGALSPDQDDDPSTASEEDNRAAAPNDPRNPGETQPPTEESY